MLALSKRVQRRLPRNQVILLGLFCSACWGIASVLSKSSLNEMPAMLLLVVQLVCSNLLLGALVLWKRPVFPARKEVLIFLGVGAISPGLSFTFAMVGLSMTSVTSETLIWSTETIMILFLSWIILREPLGLPLVALSITATVGVICVTVTADGHAGGTRSNLGDFLVLLGTACSAMDVILTRRYVDKIDPLWLITLCQISGLLFALAAAALAASWWPAEFWGALHGGAELLTLVPHAAKSGGYTPITRGLLAGLGIAANRTRASYPYRGVGGRASPSGVVLAQPQPMPRQRVEGEFPAIDDDGPGPSPRNAGPVTQAAAGAGSPAAGAGERTAAGVGVMPVDEEQVRRELTLRRLLQAVHADTELDADLGRVPGGLRAAEAAELAGMTGNGAPAAHTQQLRQFVAKPASPSQLPSIDDDDGSVMHRAAALGQASPAAPAVAPGSTISDSPQQPRKAGAGIASAADSAALSVVTHWERRSGAIPMRAWVLAGLSGMLQHALPFWVYTIVLNNLEANIAGFFLNLIPVFGIAGAYVLLGETLNTVQWFGAVLILTAMLGMARFYKEGSAHANASLESGDTQED